VWEKSKSERSERALRRALVSLRTWGSRTEAQGFGLAGLGTSIEAFGPKIWSLLFKFVTGFGSRLWTRDVLCKALLLGLRVIEQGLGFGV
jgi:hypothetical protein